MPHCVLPDVLYDCLEGLVEAITSDPRQSGNDSVAVISNKVHNERATNATREGATPHYTDDSGDDKGEDEADESTDDGSAEASKDEAKDS
jgi:hypothetical protein